VFFYFRVFPFTDCSLYCVLDLSLGQAVMNFSKLLASYSSGSLVPEAPVRPQYKHALHDTLQAIWEGSKVGAGSKVGEGPVVTAECGEPAAERDLAAPAVLGLLFIIIDKLPFESVWRLWLKECSACHQMRVRIWIHAKFPKNVTSPWVQERLVKSFQLKPDWGSLELTDVMIRMLKEAVEGEEGGGSGGLPPTHFVFVSESCVPIASLDKTMREISLSRNVSWMNYNTTSTNGYAQQGQFDVLKGIIPAQCVVKADQWIMLSRQHAQTVLSLPEKLGSPVLPLFKKVRASDEMYFPCCLAVLGYITIASGSHSSSSILRRPVTWCDWSEKGKNPKVYTGLTNATVMEALAKGCLFFRKVKLSDDRPDEEIQFAQSWVRLILGAPDLLSDHVCGLDETAIAEFVSSVISEKSVYRKRDGQGGLAISGGNFGSEIQPRGHQVDQDIDSGHGAHRGGDYDDVRYQQQRGRGHCNAGRRDRSRSRDRNERKDCDR